MTFKCLLSSYRAKNFFGIMFAVFWCSLKIYDLGRESIAFKLNIMNNPFPPAFLIFDSKFLHFKNYIQVRCIS